MTEPEPEPASLRLILWNKTFLSVQSLSKMLSFGPPGDHQPNLNVTVSYTAGCLVSVWAKAMTRGKSPWGQEDSLELEADAGLSFSGNSSLCVCSVASDSLLPSDCSLPDSSIHGILQARILKWVAIPFSRQSSRSKDRTHVSWIAGRFFTADPPRKP